MNSTREERPRRHRTLGAAFFSLCMGTFFLATGFNRPTISNMRTIDLLHLLATGGWFGVGLVTLVRFLVDRRKG